MAYRIPWAAIKNMARALVQFLLAVPDTGVTACLENLLMSGNFKDIREKSWQWAKLGNYQGKIGSGKIVVAILWLYQDIVHSYLIVSYMF